MNPLFDCALHFRFLQKATEAMFEMGQASVAASLACQKRFYDEMTPDKLRSEPKAASPVNWFGDWTPAIYRQPEPPPQPDLMQSWLAMANACTAYWSGPQSATAFQPRALPMNPMLSAAVLPAFWGMSPWTMYQGPMVAMMLSYGVPYAVAAPTARASTSAMDAADAACAQWRLVFGSDEGRKSLARNVPPSPRWPTYLH